MNHAMIDIETLDVTVESVVLSVGLVVFDRNRIISREEWFLDVSEQKQRTTSVETISFWIKQDAVAKEIFNKCFDPDINTTPYDCNVEVGETLRTLEVERVWANHIDFDIAILKHMWSQHSCNAPWSYRQVRDWATIYAEFKEGITSPPDSPVAHSAIYDAEWQAKRLQNMWLERPALSSSASVQRAN